MGFSEGEPADDSFILKRLPSLSFSSGSGKQQYMCYALPINKYGSLHTALYTSIQMPENSETGTCFNRIFTTMRRIMVSLDPEVYDSS